MKRNRKSQQSSVKRKYRKTSDRRLSLRDLAVFEFLWLWKVATTNMLGEVAFNGKSHWWVYKALKQLEDEKYILKLPRGRNIEQELWTLTNNGFEVFLMDRDDIKNYRYRVHAPSHDFLGTCLQLGDYFLKDVGQTYFTEQMLASLAPSNFPRNFRSEIAHIPDGVTVFKSAVKSATVGYEVDLNLKDIERYKDSLKYYFALDPLAIIWLVKNEWMAAKIFHSNDRDNDEKVKKKISFVFLDDFKKNLWAAKVVNGTYKGMSIGKVHANLLQSLGKESPKTGQNELLNIFFQKYKSPQKLGG